MEHLGNVREYHGAVMTIDEMDEDLERLYNLAELWQHVGDSVVEVWRALEEADPRRPSLKVQGMAAFNWVAACKADIAELEVERQIERGLLPRPEEMPEQWQRVPDPPWWDHDIGGFLCIGTAVCTLMGGIVWLVS